MNWGEISLYNLNSIFNLIFMNTKKQNLTIMKTKYLGVNMPIKFLASLLLCFTLVTSCSDDDNPNEVNEEEFITDVILTFTNVTDATDEIVMTNNAPDGQDGGFTNSVVGAFTEGATYSLELEILNSQEDPADDVLNDDIIPEADEHFFSYVVSAGLDMSVTRDATDIDGPDGTKLGVFTTWTANTAGTGTFTIILTHEPEGPDDSDPLGSVTGGETDFEITFEFVVIQ
jgi:hypothetical protein